MKILHIIAGLVCMTMLWAQCPPIDLSTVSGNAVVEGFETMTVDQPPGPCYDTLWLPANSSVQANNGWIVRNNPSDLNAPGNTVVGNQSLRIGFLDFDTPPDTATVVYGPPLQLVPLRKYRVANLWWWRDNPASWLGSGPSHSYYLRWHLTDGVNTIEIRRDTLDGGTLLLNALFQEPLRFQSTFRLNSNSPGPWRLGIEARVEFENGTSSFLFIDSVAIAQVPNDLAYVLNASYTGSGSAILSVTSYGNSSTENDTILITLPCDMPLDNVTGFNVELTPGTTLNPSSIDGDYNNPTRSRSFTMTSEDGTVTRTLVVIVTPRHTPNVTISAGGANGTDLFITNPSPFHTSYAWQFSTDNTSWSYIPGATAATYTATQNGYYRVEVDSAGCVGYSNTIHITTLASHYVAGGQVRVYPNPMGNVVHVEAPDAIKGVVLYGADGRLVRKWSFPSASNQVRLEVGNLPAGLYMLHIEGANSITPYRIQKTE